MKTCRRRAAAASKTAGRRKSHSRVRRTRRRQCLTLGRSKFCKESQGRTRRQKSSKSYLPNRKLTRRRRIIGGGFVAKFTPEGIVTIDLRKILIEHDADLSEETIKKFLNLPDSAKIKITVDENNPLKIQIEIIIDPSDQTILSVINNYIKTIFNDKIEAKFTPEGIIAVEIDSTTLKRTLRLDIEQFKRNFKKFIAKYLHDDTTIEFGQRGSYIQIRIMLHNEIESILTKLNNYSEEITSNKKAQLDQQEARRQEKVLYDNPNNQQSPSAHPVYVNIEPPRSPPENKD